VPFRISEDDVRECLSKADFCARAAALEQDPALRLDYELMCLRWRSLARSHEFAQKLLQGLGSEIKIGVAATG
jgi:hypothetical protein